MKYEKRFRDDDYEGGYPRSKRDKGRDRRRKGESDIWADLISRADSLEDERPSTWSPDKKPEPKPENKGKWQPPFQMNQDATIEVKGFKIDLSRVDHLTKVDTTYNGRPSHGIEFAFFGKRGLGRTIWYGTNAKQRDEEYARYEAIRAKAAEGRV